MTFTPTSPLREPPPIPGEHHHNRTSGFTWAAIIAGVFLSLAVTCVLAMLGSAFELTSLAPDASTGTAETFTVKVAIWMIIMQWVSGGMGGYIAGRMRCKWQGLHTHEVFFRDTAHGLITWAVATVLMVALFSSSGAAIIGGTLKTGGMLAAGAGMGVARSVTSGASINGASDNGVAAPSAYYIDNLLRPATPNSNGSLQDQRVEVVRILSFGLKNGDVSDNDKTYLANIVSTRAGISQADAQKRVDDTVAQLKRSQQEALQKAETARKVSLKTLVYLVLSMLIGAFVASAAAAYGGSQRDEY